MAVRHGTSGGTTRETDDRPPARCRSARRRCRRWARRLHRGVGRDRPARRGNPHPLALVAASRCRGGGAGGRCPVRRAAAGRGGCLACARQPALGRGRLGCRGRDDLRHACRRRIRLLRLREPGRVVRRRPAHRASAARAGIQLAQRRCNADAPRLYAGTVARGPGADLSPGFPASPHAVRAGFTDRGVPARSALRRRRGVPGLADRPRAWRAAGGRPCRPARRGEPDLPVSGRAADERRAGDGVLAGGAVACRRGAAVGRRRGRARGVGGHPGQAEPRAARVARGGRRGPGDASGGPAPRAGLRRRRGARRCRAGRDPVRALRVAAGVRIRPVR